MAKVLCILLIAVGLFGIVSAIWTAGKDSAKNNCEWYRGFSMLFAVIGSLVVFFAGCVFLDLETNPPKMPPCAIDVYRGKTDISVTSVDGIPTDTVVIWKAEIDSIHADK